MKRRPRRCKTCKYKFEYSKEFIDGIFLSHVLASIGGSRMNWLSSSVAGTDQSAHREEAGLRYCSCGTGEQHGQTGTGRSYNRYDPSQI